MKTYAISSPEAPVAALVTPPSSQTETVRPTLLDASGFVFDPLAYWARVTPNHTAICGATGTAAWSYREVEERTNQIAHALSARGVRHGDRVAFVLPRGLETILLLIGILKAGAAYVPLDAGSPPSRIQDCLEDAAPALVVTAEGKHPAGISRDRVVAIDALLHDAQHCNSTPLPLELSGTDLAYIIFTSGTTGRPKGVPISHAALTNFVAGNQEVCIRVGAGDRVFQGFSPASDGHHEELWPTLLAGATLVVATAREVYSGPELTAFLNQQEVTLISCAPTLLGMVEGDVPALRRILFGAENCPPALIERWWRPGREVINTYGPTEATVGATFAFCEPGQPVTIGRPLPGYFCYVVDEALAEVEDGQEGELAIAGIGVAEGYYNRPELSAGRFVASPYAEPGLGNPLLYRTGDRVRRNADGDLVWLGRIDGQVKIRGHRIELSEIESHLLGDPSVRTAVVVARTADDATSAAPDAAHLVALLVLSEDVDTAPFDPTALLDRLRDTLPAHMIPQVFEILDRVPVLPSGKIDRRSCQSMRGRPVRLAREIAPPQTATEHLLLKRWHALFPSVEISCTDDFFRDLGGHSLLASRFISGLRSEPGYASVSVLDIYEAPTLRGFAARCDTTLTPQQAQAQTVSNTERLVETTVSPAMLALSRVLQTIGVLLLFGVQALHWLGPVIAALYCHERGAGVLTAIAAGLLVHTVSIPAFLLFAVATKWIVGGRFRAGSYPLWGGVFLRWWFVNRVLAAAPVGLLCGTPLAALYLRLLGARVGHNVQIESLEIDCPDLISLGDDCVLENSAWLLCAEVTRGVLRLRPITVGDGCTIGVRAGLAGGATLQEGVALRDLSSAGAGVVIPAGEEWEGSPARPAAQRRAPVYDRFQQPSLARRIAWGTVQALLGIVLAVLEELPFLVIAYTILWRQDHWIESLVWEPFCAVALIALAAAQVLIVKWGIGGRFRAGVYHVYSAAWVRKWFADRHLEALTAIIDPIYDSLMAGSWCRALGMKCGARCEIALPRRILYDLVEMGSESFIASEVSVGTPLRGNGKVVLEKTVIGQRTFLGNDSVVPQGSAVPDNALLGVLSVWPGSEVVTSPGETWLGSPSFRLPARQVAEGFDAEYTYCPSRRLYADRFAHELLRLVLPSLCGLLVAAVVSEGFIAVWHAHSLVTALLCTPLIYTAGVLLAVALIWLSKAALVGHYRPAVNPLWSRFVWRAEAYSAVLHNFGAPMFVQALSGTPLLCAFMRLLGARVGARTFINTTDWTETDVFDIGTDVAINANAPLQGHLFEDRVMKIGPIRIGDSCSVGSHSVVLCGSELEPGARLGDLSLVMKGETIPANTAWEGAPAQAVRTPHHLPTPVVTTPPVVVAVAA